jgi:DNA repair photolyase
MTKPTSPAAPRKGRGASYNPDNRFFSTRSEAEDDGWAREDEELPPLKTQVSIQQSRSIISRNQSPDVPFDQSINPYQGCEHGCIYCFARPTHAYLDLSPGLDFETKLFAKPNAAELLRAELAHPRYQCRLINLGANTDPYQPIEREWKITRSLLEVLLEARHPVTLITKNALVLRDLDILTELARLELVKVMVSVTSLDHELSRIMEPRASSPQRRLHAIEKLSAAGVPVGVMMAPLIPFLNDEEIEKVMAAVGKAGAQSAGYVLLRLPYEVRDLFVNWLQEHFPLRAERIMGVLRDARGGRDNDPRFGLRMRGDGPYARLLRQRVARACRQHGLSGQQHALRTDLFRPPRVDGLQLGLFDPD